MSEVVEVLCFNFPDGSTYWCERLNTDAKKVVQRWKEMLSPEQREVYLRPEVFGGFVVVSMPRQAYQRIPATSQSHSLFE